MQRILVIGSPGAGKSTLASRIAGRLGLPLIHLDREYFGPGWTVPSKAEWRERVRALAARPAWVMDGNYASTFDIRVPRATAIVWLDLPRWHCLASVLWRVARNYGRARPDLGSDCIERFDWSFMRWIWSYPAKDAAEDRPHAAAPAARPARLRPALPIRDRGPRGRIVHPQRGRLTDADLSHHPDREAYAGADVRPRRRCGALSRIPAALRGSAHHAPGPERGGHRDASSPPCRSATRPSTRPSRPA